MSVLIELLNKLGIQVSRPDEAREPPWFVLAFDPVTRSVAVLAAGQDRESAEQAAAAAASGRPILAIDARGGERARALACYWLVDNDVVGSECTRLLDSLGEQMLRVLKREGGA